MSELTVYHYHPTTHEYVGQTKGRLDPKEHVLSVPAYATTITPVASSKNQTQIFNPTESTWTAVDDFRGVQYWLEDGSQYIITELGECKPVISLDSPPVSITLDKIFDDLDKQSSNIILQKWPKYKQTNAALGLLLQSDVDQMKRDIQTIIDAHGANKIIIQDLYDSGCTIDDLNNLVVDWPTI